jgi:hypothetical protein
MFGLPEADDEPNLLNVAGSQIVAGVFILTLLCDFN